MTQAAIQFVCPECGASHDRGWVDGVRTFRCLRCGYVGERNDAPECSGPFGDARDCPVHRLDVVGAVPPTTPSLPSDAPPATLEEYNARVARTMKLSGEGLETTVHMPCPFCAAPEFVVAKLYQLNDALRRGATCRECGRGARAIITHTAAGTTGTFLQTGGDDAPPWVTMRDRP